MKCSVRGCRGTYHIKCVEDSLKGSCLTKFKCPHHVSKMTNVMCFIVVKKFSFFFVFCLFDCPSVGPKITSVN